MAENDEIVNNPLRAIKDFLRKHPEWEAGQYYERSRRARVIGGIIVGTGKGGFLLLYCEKEL